MSPGTLVLVGLAGGLGALARLAVDSAVAARVAAPVPAGIFAVNISGTLLLGFLVGLTPPATTQLVLGVGLLGGYTTFSTWMLESQQLIEGHHLRWAAANLIGSVFFGVLAAVAGRALAGG